VLAEIGMLARLTRDLPAFLRTPVRLEDATAIVKRRLETRAERFLWMAEQMIYRHTRSPYLKLLRAAGCELGDLRNLVYREGVEGALNTLVSQGVYLSFDEFKGRRPVVRGSEQFSPTEGDFDNPDTVRHLEQLSSGSRSEGVSVYKSLTNEAELAANHALALEAHGLLEADHAIWMTAPFNQMLRYARAGRPPLAWFYPLEPLSWKIRIAGRYFQILGRLVGCPLPGPVWNDLQDPAGMAGWLGDRLAEGRSICLTAFPSSAVRVAEAAREQGLSLEGGWFIPAGEPFTPAKRRALEAVGAGVLVRYSSVETGPIGYGCADHRRSDDLHLFSDSFALIQRPRTVGDFDFSVEAFLFTSLLPSAPKILLNVENGDYGTLERRPCGCLLGRLGLSEHISEIRSYEKFTSEGMTFVKTRLLPLLEEVLPERFGGSGADYQVVEEEGSQGIPRLCLLVSPSVGAVDEEQLRQTFLDELGRGGELEGYMARMWERAGTVKVRRRVPIATGIGKVQPFHVAKERLS